jgi:hypothetical protein
MNIIVRSVGMCLKNALSKLTQKESPDALDVAVLLVLTNCYHTALTFVSTCTTERSYTNEN